MGSNNASRLLWLQLQHLKGCHRPVNDRSHNSCDRVTSGDIPWPIQPCRHRLSSRPPRAHDPISTRASIRLPASSSSECWRLDSSTSCTASTPTLRRRTRPLPPIYLTSCC